jgi:hypothetical protein
VGKPLCEFSGRIEFGEPDVMDAVDCDDVGVEKDVQPRNETYKQEHEDESPLIA